VLCVVFALVSSLAVTDAQFELYSLLILPSACTAWAPLFTAYSSASEMSQLPCRSSSPYSTVVFRPTVRRASRTAKKVFGFVRKPGDRGQIWRFFSKTANSWSKYYSTVSTLNAPMISRDVIYAAYSESQHLEYALNIFDSRTVMRVRQRHERVNPGLRPSGNPHGESEHQ
jgi:hypothetical protein